MFWGLVALALVAVLALPAWRLYQGWRLARTDDGLLLLLLQMGDQPADQHIGWLGKQIAAERQGEARAGHIATLEILLANALTGDDRKHDALVLYERHLPQPGLWEKYLPRAEVLLKWGVTAWQVGQYAQSAKAIDAALEAAPKDPTALRVRGLVERKLTADLDETAKWFERSLEASEPDQRAFNTCKIACYLAELRADHGEYEAAAASMGDAITAFRATKPELSMGQQVEIAGFALTLTKMLCRLGRVAEARRSIRRRCRKPSGGSRWRSRRRSSSSRGSRAMPPGSRPRCAR